MEGVDCIVHYVPAAEGPRLQALLRSVGVVNDWALAPNVQQSVKSTDLSDLLSGAFGELSTRYRCGDHPGRCVLMRSRLINAYCKVEALRLLGLTPLN